MYELPRRVPVRRFSRRAVTLGGAAVLFASPAMARPSLLLPKIPASYEIRVMGWLGEATAGFAAGWLLEALKGYGLIPGTHAATLPKVADHHIQEANVQANEGYAVNRVYSGPYSEGDIAVSSAQQGDDYFAFATADHPLRPNRRSTCTLVHRSYDIFALNALSAALCKYDVPTDAMQSKALPIHGQKQGTYDNYGHTAWREAMTANGGSVRWKTRERDGRLTALAEVDAPGLKAHVEYTG